jgi:predicted phosphodiesterase
MQLSARGGVRPLAARRRRRQVRRMADTLRIAHCADIHLDGAAHGDAGLGPDGVYRRGFVAVLAAMRAQTPDLMLLAGDLFDSNRASLATIEWAMDTLARQPFPIVMIPGNHDCMDDGAIFARHDFDRIPNVTLLAAPQGGIAHLPALDVAVWGKGMVEHSPAFRPLAGCPPRPAGIGWYLAMGHGLFVPRGADTHRSSPIHQHQIEASPCDYIALGHHHAAMEIVTGGAAAAFSGSPTDDLGLGATYAMIDLSPGRRPQVAIRTLPPRTG